MDGAFEEFDPDTGENKSAYVQDDTMAPLAHPVTREMYDSRGKYIKDTRRMGLTICGNELQSQRKRTLQNKITDEVVLDRIHKAESIYNDPTKYRARINENLERLDRWNKLINGRR